MEKRTSLACDQCHGHKLKCTPLSHGCVRCNRLNIRCTSSRVIKKRGRKSARETQGAISSPAADAPDYPVLDYVQGLFLVKVNNTQSACTPRLSRFEACRLLEHFYESPNREFHTRLIRRYRLLDPHTPRPTSPSLLLSILCSAIFMPRDDQISVLLQRTPTELTALRLSLFDELTRHFHPLTLPDNHHVFDDALTAFMITSIAPSDKSVESTLQYWLSFLKFIVQKLNLHIDTPELSDEDREERRRLWWAAYIIDRHSALSFNGRTQITDQGCRRLPRPCPDIIWDLPERLPLGSNSFDDIGYNVSSIDMFGLYVPLSKVLGEILEHHFLCDHPTFNQNRDYLANIRIRIERNLELWFDSFRSLVGADFCKAAELNWEPYHADQYPQLAYYALHMYHCMYVLLYGPMDIVRMHEDLEWQASADFIVAGEHAIACANVARHILKVDPYLHLMYRYYGTYFLQSCFMFLILAKKLGDRSDSLILGNCAINLQVLDRFVLTTNMDYQRAFAKLLRNVLSSNVQRNSVVNTSTEGSTSSLEGAPPSLDPEMLRYRWIPGFKGLLPNTDIPD